MLLSLAATVALTGCGNNEAKRTLAELERMREAAAVDRAPLLDALEGTRASDPIAEKARTTCVAAYRRLALAQHSASEATAATSATAKERITTTQQAEDDIAAADKELGACREAMIELRRHVANS